MSQDVMRTIDEILEQLKRLSAEEREELLQKLEDAVQDDQLNARGHRATSGPYARTLAAAGTGQTDFPDVSSRKAKHLAEAYAPNKRSK
jgi:hypothetical protein